MILKDKIKRMLRKRSWITSGNYSDIRLEGMGRTSQISFMIVGYLSQTSYTRYSSDTLLRAGILLRNISLILNSNILKTTDTGTPFSCEIQATHYGIWPMRYR